MSNFVNEIVKSIREQPFLWIPISNSYRFDGISMDGVNITGYRNTRLLSVIEIGIRDKRVEISFIDRWKLETAVMWWYQNCTVEHLKMCK